MYSAISANKRNTVLIMLVFILLVWGLGYLFAAIYGSMGIMWGALVGATVYALFQYFVAARMAISMSGAQEIQKQDNPRLYRIVENLAITTGMPMPKR